MLRQSGWENGIVRVPADHLNGRELTFHRLLAMVPSRNDGHTDTTALRMFHRNLCTQGIADPRYARLPSAGVEIRN